MFYVFVGKSIKKLGSLVLVCSLMFLFLLYNAYAIPSHALTADENSFYLGRYPQSEITDVSGLVCGKDYIEKNGKLYKVEPIKWKVIREDDSSLLVVSENNLDFKPFTEDFFSDISWENSNISKWLNRNTSSDDSFNYSDLEKNGFLASAFTDDEKSKILADTVSYTEYTQIPFADTCRETKFVHNQKIFLLSSDDLNEKSLYNSLSDPDMIAKNTDFVNSYNDVKLGSTNNYWLRDLYFENTLLDSFETAFFVNTNNKIDTKWVCRNACVRPTMKVEKSVLR